MRELLRLESGQELQTHRWDECSGQWCVIHNPLPGPWALWPRSWRSDRGLMERTCPCGVGHPAAEMYLWAGFAPGSLVHGCCGRCQCAPTPAPVLDKGAELHGRILDRVIDLWPASPSATVVLTPAMWQELRSLLLETGDYLTGRSKER